MKKLALLYMLACLASSFLFAQHLNLAWQPEFFNQPHGIEPFEEGWVVAGELNAKSYSPRGPYVARIGPQGLLWGRRWLGGNPISLSAFAVLPDNRIAITGVQGGCDTSGNPFFIVYNSSGEEVYVKAEELGSTNSWVPDISEVASLPNGGFLATDIVFVFTLDDTLGYKSHYGVDFPDETLHLLTQSNDTTFWVGFCNGRQDFWQILPFTIQEYAVRREMGLAPFDLAVGATLLDLKAHEGTVYALTEDGIWENRPPYRAPAYHPLPISGRDYFKLHRIPDAFLLLGTDGQGRANIMQLDTSYRFVNQWTYDSRSFKPVDFAVRAGILAILGQLSIPAGGRFFSHSRQRAPGEANTLFALKTFELDGATEAPRADVAITGLAWTGASEVFPSYCILDECGSLYRLELDGFSISVRNNSPFTVNSLVLNTRRPYCFNCYAFCEGHQAYWQRYEGLQLRPGQETTLAFDQPMEFQHQYFDPDFELCFWASDADGHLEKDYDNNLYCEVLPLGIAPPSAAGWNMYPNPAENELYIRFSPATARESRLSAYNLAGQRVLLSLLPPQSLSYRLQVRALPAGVYLLVWENGDEREAQRFVKI